MWPNTELFLIRIQSEYEKTRTRNNSVFGHFSRSEILLFNLFYSFVSELKFRILKFELLFLITMSVLKG